MKVSPKMDRQIWHSEHEHEEKSKPSKDSSNPQVFHKSQIRLVKNSWGLLYLGKLHGRFTNRPTILWG